MTFTEALAVLLRGGKVRRPHWNKYALMIDGAGYLTDDSGQLPLVDSGDMTATDWLELAE